MISFTFAKNSKTKRDLWHSSISNRTSFIVDLDKEHLTTILENSPNVNNRTASNAILEIPSFNGSKRAFKFFKTNLFLFLRSYSV